MPDWLTKLSGIIAVASTIVTTTMAIYTLVVNRRSAKQKQLDEINGKVTDHESRIIQTEKVTKVVEEFMEDLLLEQLKGRQPNKRK